MTSAEQPGIVSSSKESYPLLNSADHFAIVTGRKLYKQSRGSEKEILRGMIQKFWSLPCSFVKRHFWEA